MKRLWFAVVISLSLAAGPIWAQVRVDATTARHLADRGGVTTAAAARVTALLGQTLGDPAIAGATSPESLAQAIGTKAQMIADTREELARIASTLDALPPLPNPDDLDLVRSAEQDGRNIAELARRSDDALAALQTVFDAVRTRDQVRFNAAIGRIGSGAVLMQQAQAAMMRAQAGLQDPSWPAHAQFLAMACLSDAQAAMQSGISGLQSRPEAVGEMAVAEQCVRDQIVRGRSLLDTNDRHPLRVRLGPLDAELFEAMGDGAQCISASRDAVARTEGAPAVAGAFNACYAPVGARIHGLIARQHQVLASMS